jgi:glycosyltransferase involved in cell wall biosynthesis
MDPIAGKKVLFVITKSNWGGAQAYVYGLARYLKEKGAEVTVALGGTGEPGAETGLLAERLGAAGVNVIVLSSFARDISVRQEFSALHELRSAIRSLRPDIVHLNSSKAGGLGALAARLEGVPRIIFTAHGWAHREPRPFLKRFFIKIVSWMTIILVHKVIVVSERDYRDSPTLFSRNKIILIRNGVSDFAVRPKQEAREVLAHATQINVTDTWLVMQAELHPNKGVDVAIAALKEVLPLYPSTSLLIMGEGETRLALEKQISELELTHRVFLLGFISDSRSYLSAADVYVMPSRKEGLPLALLEAGLVKLPVIASAVGGIPEIIKNGENGLLIASNDVSALASALCALLADPEKAQRMGEELYNHVQKEFSETRMVSETIAAYLKD